MLFFRQGYRVASNAYHRLLQGLTSLLEGKKQKSTIAPLDGVRAIACLSVVAYHLTLITTHDLRLWRPDRLPALVTSIMFTGDTGVNLFFILSGFLLFMPYAKALLFDQAWPAMRTFYIRRVLRILPVYYVSLFLMILIYRPDFLLPKRMGDLFMFLILFLDSSPTAFKQINGPFWTLAVEWQFYLILPLLALGIAFVVRRGSLRRRLVALLACLVALMAWGLLTRFLGVYLTQNPTHTLHIPHKIVSAGLFLFYGVPNAGLHGKFIEDFAVGMLISTLYILARSGNAMSALTKFLRRFSPLLFAVGILWLLVMATWKYNQNNPHTWPLFDGLHDLYTTAGELSFGIGYGFCVIAILFGMSWLRRPFEWTPLRWIGLISYGLYMWHLLLLESFTDLVIRHIHGLRTIEIYGLYWLCVFLFIIPCVLLLFGLVEKPWIALGDKWTRKEKLPRQDETLNKASEQEGTPVLTRAGK